MQSATPGHRFATLCSLGVDSAFDGGRCTADGGLPWVAEADRALGLCAALAACIPEWRRTHIQHSREVLVRQRVFQSACGYADQNDATMLRDDPLFQVVCGQLPESGAPLASQPTLSRLENAVDRQACRRLAHPLRHPPRSDCADTSVLRAARDPGVADLVLCYAQDAHTAKHAAVSWPDRLLARRVGRLCRTRQ